MERPNLDPVKLRQDIEARIEQSEEMESANKLELLSEAAAVHFGYDAQFAYFGKGGAVYIMSFDDALKICGRHIEDASVDDLVQQLTQMHKQYTLIAGSSDAEYLLEKGVHNGQQKLAQRAIEAQ